MKLNGYCLDDARLSLFITHCGQGSTIEAVTAGKPLIVIPVLGDQQRNAQVSITLRMFAIQLFRLGHQENWNGNNIRKDFTQEF